MRLVCVACWHRVEPVKTVHFRPNKHPVSDCHPNLLIICGNAVISLRKLIIDISQRIVIGCGGDQWSNFQRIAH